MESLGTSPGALPSRGPWFSSLYVVSIDTGHISMPRYMSGPRWSPAFKMEAVLSVSSLNITTNNVLVVQLLSSVQLFLKSLSCV